MPSASTITNGGIASLTVSGLKSIQTRQTLAVKPLTILAGTNSSGKSSFLQALLLLKQTLDASFDPGPLRLDGPNVRFTSADQLFFHAAGQSSADRITVGINSPENEQASDGFELEFVRGKDNRGLDLATSIYPHEDRTIRVFHGMDFQAAKKEVFSGLEGPVGMLIQRSGELEAAVKRDRCFLEFVLRPIDEDRHFLTALGLGPGESIKKSLRSTIHLPGLRGNPERTYPVTSTGPEYQGTFDKYTASVVAEWSQLDKGKLLELGDELRNLGLTWKVAVSHVNDTEVELKVGRLPTSVRGGAHDLVNIADVGFGVSQTLPVIVALLAAAPGQLVYIEQPEIHLHPRAQVALSRSIANAAIRGVRVVIETHSRLLLLGIQSLVADGILPEERVALHWFERSDVGATIVSTAQLDEAGTFGAWPVDFDTVNLETQMHFLNAVEARRS